MPFSSRAHLLLLIIFALIFLEGCATYQGKVQKARDFLAMGSTDEALKILKPLADLPNKDQLVYVLDYATALQAAGQFEESNLYFHRADKLSEIQDYTSLSLETGSLLTGEEAVQYKGEDFEIILINAMSALNYLSLGNKDEALVEVRRLNEKLRRFRLEAKRNFTDNPLALYLSAMIYESAHQWDDAAIAYEQVYNIAPNYSGLPEDLIRSNLKAKRIQAYEKWKARFPFVRTAEKTNSKINENKKEKDWGEVVIIYQSGWGPRKNFRYDNFRFPAMYPVWSVQQDIDIALKPLSSSAPSTLMTAEFQGPSREPLFEVDPIAVQSLESQYLALVARRMAGIVAKQMVAERIRRDNALMGDLAQIAMSLSDRADLRQWSTLPKLFKVYRMRVPSGEYSLHIDSQEKNSRLLVKPNGKVFVNHRTFR